MAFDRAPSDNEGTGDVCRNGALSARCVLGRLFDKVGGEAAVTGADRRLLHACSCRRKFPSPPETIHEQKEQTDGRRRPLDPDVVGERARGAGLPVGRFVKVWAMGGVGTPCETEADCVGARVLSFWEDEFMVDREAEVGSCGNAEIGAEASEERRAGAIADTRAGSFGNRGCVLCKICSTGTDKKVVLGGVDAGKNEDGGTDAEGCIAAEGFDERFGGLVVGRD